MEVGRNVAGESIVMKVEKLKERKVCEMRRNGSGKGRVTEFKGDDSELDGVAENSMPFAEGGIWIPRM